MFSESRRFGERRKQKADELTFEQPEETEKEVKPDGAAVIRNRADAVFLRQRKWYRGYIVSRLSKKFEGRDFFIFRKKTK